MAIIKLNDIVQPVYGDGDADSCGTLPQTPPDDTPPPVSGIIFADYFDQVHPPWNDITYDYDTKWTPSSPPPDFDFGNLIPTSPFVPDDGTTAVALALGAIFSGNQDQYRSRVFGPTEFPLMLPNTQYTITGRIACFFNDGYGNTHIGFKANGVPALLLLSDFSGENVPWQTITCQALSDSNAEVTVQWGFFDIHQSGFVVQTYVDFDSLVGSYP